MGKKAKVNPNPVETVIVPEEDFERLFKDNSIRFALDALLRANGFELWRRVEGKKPEWKKKGEIYTQAEAIYYLDPDKVDDAVYMQDLYYEGFV